VNADEMVEEADLSGELLQKLQAEHIDALVGVVGGRGLSILYKLTGKAQRRVRAAVDRERHRGHLGVLRLQQRAQLHDRDARPGPPGGQSAHKIGVVEVLGDQAGWLALQAGIAVCADAVLIPEIPCDLQAVAARLQDKVTARRPWGWCGAEGATFIDGRRRAAPSSLKASCRRWRR